MKKIRTLLVGVVVGAGLGINTGTLISSAIDYSNTWFMIETGLKIGSAIGLAVSVFLIMANDSQTGTFLKRTSI